MKGLQSEIKVFWGSAWRDAEEIVKLREELKAARKQLELEVDERKLWKWEASDLEAAFKVMRKQHFSEMHKMQLSSRLTESVPLVSETD